jgi:deoxyguanosine kinase
MYIAVEGVIGVGKTTLVRLLRESFSANMCLEVFEENPFLARFYEDRDRYAFQTQMFFLLSRYHQQQREISVKLGTAKHLLADYTFDKDAIFAQINLAGDELDMYHRIHEALAEKIAQPDLIVYLRARTDTLMQRITLRDRTYERNMAVEYIARLAATYERYFQNRSLANVMILDTDDIDIVKNPADYIWVENRIRQALQMSPFQATLPLIS